jgi:hypothetical protein
MLLKSYPLLFILSCIIILSSVQADFAIYSQDNIPSSNPCTACIAANFDRVILNMDDVFLENYEELRNANFTGVIDGYLTVHENATVDDNTWCNLIVSNLPHGFNGTIWMTPQNTIFVLSTFASTVQICMGAGLKVGVNSDVMAWYNLYGYVDVSSTVLTSLPLWYNAGNNNTNFDDFLDYAGFGGWSTPTMKSLNTALNPVLCYSPCNIQALIYY